MKQELQRLIVEYLQSKGYYVRQVDIADKGAYHTGSELTEQGMIDGIYSLSIRAKKD